MNEGRPFDASRVYPRLYQGALPPDGRAVVDAGFHLLVLCAEELQDGQYEGVLALRCPMDDSNTRPISDLEKRRALGAAQAVAVYYNGGARVLVTCAQGRNRSGLVTALALRELTHWPAARCMEAVRAARADVLTNTSFVEFIESLP